MVMRLLITFFFKFPGKQHEAACKLPILLLEGYLLTFDSTSYHVGRGVLTMQCLPYMSDERKEPIQNLFSRLLISSPFTLQTRIQDLCIRKLENVTCMGDNFVFQADRQRISQATTPFALKQVLIIIQRSITETLPTIIQFRHIHNVKPEIKRKSKKPVIV